jgi:DNA-binding CsgD family transcriptional regulator
MSIVKPFKFVIFEKNNLIQFAVKKIVHDFCSQTEFVVVSDIQNLLLAINKNAVDLVILGEALPLESQKIFFESLDLIYTNKQILTFYEEAFGQKQTVGDLIFSYYDPNTNHKYLINFFGNFFANHKSKKHKRNNSRNSLSLSSRELQVAKLLTQGYGNLEISKILSLNTTTVSTYKKRIFSKFNITNVIQLFDFL